ncbi:MAG: hypothetical protein OXH90_07215 [Paracoccaceae bacterium]|nr:hypothetical protein [Paracoccaceae bacterium]MDE2916478.1 hypothetical protein [Paracoccaceae bacterium]
MTFNEYRRIKKTGILSYSLMSTVISVGLLYPSEFSAGKYSSKPGQDLKSVGNDIWKVINLHEKTKTKKAVA